MRITPTTTMSSMSVKAPLNLLVRHSTQTPLQALGGDFIRVISASSFRRSRSRLLLQGGDDADERREESQHNRADDHRQKNNHDWLKHRCEGHHCVIDFIIKHVGDLQKHFGELTSFFAHVDHADHHRRKCAAGFHRLHNRFAFFHAVVHLPDGGGNRRITCSFASNIQCLQNRNTACDQCPECARETGDRGFAVQIAKKRHAQFEVINKQSPATRTADELVNGHRSHHEPEHNKAIVLQQATHSDNKPSDGRQRFVAEQVVENHFEPRHNEDEEKTQDGHGHCHYDYRIDHCRYDFVSDFGGLLLKFRQPGEHELK